jgi:prepilin-type N-terminal cleavage/methylation domain-containing protein
MNKFKQITEKGFTLAEVIAVTLIIGIFAAMGTPNWFAYLAKQRLNDANEQLYSVLINAQQKAMKDSSAYTVALQQSGLIPQYKVYPKQANINTIPTSVPWQNLAKDKDQFKLVLTEGSKIIFDYQSKIHPDSELQTNEKIILTFQNGSSAPQKCIIVKTVFGYLYTTSDEQCQ